MANKAAYDNDSIEVLKGADRVRKKPAVIFGSDGIEGCEHAVFEIISNSVDEAREGFGDTIVVTRFEDKSVEVQDFGRGLPVGYNQKEKRYNWELLFCEMYAGGKYKTNDGGSYQYSLGTNGLGLCATQYASEYMEAEIHSGGFCYKLSFKKGKPVGKMIEEPYGKKDTGTRIKWRPDLAVFTDIDIPLEYFQDIMRRQAIVNAGIKFILKNQKDSKFETFEYVYEKGIVDHVKETVGDNALTSINFWTAERTGRDRADQPDYNLKINAAVCFSNKVQLKEFYHNSSFLEHGGAPEKAVKSAFVSQIDTYLKQNGKYLKSDAKINFQDVEDCLVLVTSSFSTNTSYENQTKKAITNKFIQEAMTDFFKHQLEVYFIENKLDADKICDQVLINMRSRIKAETTRLNIKRTLQSSNDMANRVQKFVDCRSRDVSERELFIVEGDSALGACKQARDSTFQAIIPVRGKILNCLKAEYNKIFANDIITDLIKVLGCGVEVKTKAMKDMVDFNIDQLRWSKVIICTDADVDGFQIRTLILAMIYRLMPTLIEKGKVFIAESPLYEINTKDETWFAYTEKEKQDILDEIGNGKFTIQRSKGLGENDADMMSLTTMNPSTRRLIKIDPTDAQRTADMFDLWLGDNLAGRKDHIAREGYAYIAMADVS
ncbi:MAG: toprim domain-containing protein [Clostridia bacterium]|nr:toprim domain-containing protein [Clostridia bacterium]